VTGSVAASDGVCRCKRRGLWPQVTGSVAGSDGGLSLQVTGVRRYKNTQHMFVFGLRCASDGGLSLQVTGVGGGTVD
jgi:hypothetical protein